MLVHIKNFQSIEDCKLEIPEKAFTCIVGPSNIGKSAIRRALECVFYNRSESSYIRKGSKECTVEVTFEDGQNIKWSRDEKTSRYEINGEKYSKLNKTVPEVLTDRGIKELVINKEKFDVQVATQFSHIFLLDQTGSKVTEVLSNLGNLNRIITANKACLNDIKNNKSVLKVRKDDLISLKEKINSFNGLDAQISLISSLKEILNNLKDLKIKKEKAQNLSNKLEKSYNLVETLNPIKKIKILDLDVDINKILFLKKISIKIQESNNKLKILNSVKKIDDSNFFIDVDYNKFSNAKKLLDQIEKSNLVISYSSKLKNIKILDLDIDYSRFEKIKEIYSKITLYKNSILKIRSDHKKCEEKLESLQLEKNNILKDLKVCPLCDSHVG